MLKLSLALMMLFQLVPFTTEGQSYVTAMGLRMGSNFGISLQQKIIGNLTTEGIITTTPASDLTAATLLLEIHNPLISKRFNFYIGGGVHQQWQSALTDGSRYNLRGVTGIAGGEMTLGRINISWDYKPMYHLNSDSQPFQSETAVSLRYVFIKKVKNKNRKKLFQPSPKKKRQKQRQKEKRKKMREKEKANNNTAEKKKFILFSQT